MSGDAINVILEAARNIYGASEGHIHPASAICLGRVFFEWRARDALKAARDRGEFAHPWDTLAREFGMTREEYEQYVYDHDYPYQWQDMHELNEWKEAHDPMVEFAKLVGGGKYGRW